MGKVTSFAGLKRKARKAAQFEKEGLFARALMEAENAAADAAREWLAAAQARGPRYSVHNADIYGNITGPAVGHMLDVCGFGWLEFKDRRSDFYRYCKKVVNHQNAKIGWRSERTLHRVPIHGAYEYFACRQEMGLKEAAMRAAADVLAKHGISVRVCSRID